ncbi:hypothetical protein FWK35_00007257 [Aphis craccivora]|uniref:Uncharacterized protein n=1 Tax=Aphis craccivora TaxID=307492 RepID=A0A6G0YXD2_APHCR|nr:hypothetical protein FWK35_00007257 [Aphis craccivora]
MVRWRRWWKQIMGRWKTSPQKILRVKTVFNVYLNDQFVNWPVVGYDSI